MSCPVCSHDVDTDSAVEWDNGEPAPGSGKWGMCVCALCCSAICGEIPPWQYAGHLLYRERELVADQRKLLQDLREKFYDAIGEIERIVR